jgi:methylmalonyl-CoA mutase N-terminal domain/subunit
MERMSESGLPIDPVYEDSKLTDFRPEDERGQPGKYPHPRGVYPGLREQRDPRNDRRNDRCNDPPRAGATIGEACGALRDVWGGYQPERI